MDEEITSVLTPMMFAVPPGEVWNRLMFYEQIDERPRLRLPYP